MFSVISRTPVGGCGGGGGGSYPSEEMQSVYFTAQSDWAIYIFWSSRREASLLDAVQRPIFLTQMLHSIKCFVTISYFTQIRVYEDNSCF